MKIDELKRNSGSSLPELIGQTPLLRLEQLTRDLKGIRLLAKAEWFNPSGSGMDRAAAAMVRDARARGLLVAGKTLLDASTGAMGISYAMLGAALGFPVLIAMPADVTAETKLRLAAYDAQVEWTDAEEGADGAIRLARELAGDEPERFCYVDQYSNDANWLAHFHTTGPEIWRQTQGQVTHFVAGVGTSGTLIGTARALKGENPMLQAIGVRPAAAKHGIHGLAHRSAAIVPPIYNPHLANREMEVETEAAYAMARRLASEEGLLVGPSAAAAVAVCRQIAEEEAAAGRSAVIVTVLPDAADRYFSERFWNPA